MSIPQLKNPKKLSYNELREQVSELARRMNILTDMRAVSISPTGTPNFNFSDDSATLDVPSLEELTENYEEEIAELEEELAAAKIKINCLEELLTPETLDGAGSWEHSASSLKPAYPFDPTSCTASIASNISAQAVGMNGPNVTIKWTRVNNDPACQASGSINWIISPNRSGTPDIRPSWSGARGDTTVVNKDYATGTYYIYAYGVNLDGNVNVEQYQYKGTLVISTSVAGEPNIERTFEVTNTVVEGEELPCG